MLSPELTLSDIFDLRLHAVSRIDCQTFLTFVSMLSPELTLSDNIDIFDLPLPTEGRFPLGSLPGLCLTAWTRAAPF